MTREVPILLAELHRRPGRRRSRVRHQRSGIFNADALEQVWAFLLFPIIGAVIAAFAWMALSTDDDEPAEEPAAA